MCGLSSAMLDRAIPIGGWLQPRARKGRLPIGAILAAGFAMCGGMYALGEEQKQRPPFSEIPGWAEDEHAAVWPILRKSCAALIEEKTPLRPARNYSETLRAVCGAALLQAE